MKSENLRAARTPTLKLKLKRDNPEAKFIQTLMISLKE